MSLLLDEKGPKNQGRHQGPNAQGERPSPMSAAAHAPNPVEGGRSHRKLSILNISLQVLINKNLLDSLTAQAKASPRLRMNYDLRNTPADQSQRMLNALEPGTVLPIHRHCNTSETVVVLRGKVKWLYYNDQGELTDTILVEADGDIRGVCVPMGQWHSIACLESGSVILETKDGPWEAMKEEEVLYMI